MSDEKVSTTLANHLPPVRPVPLPEPATTWERFVRAIAAGLCRETGPVPGCWCGKYGQTCHAPSIYKAQAEAAARELDREGLLPRRKESTPSSDPLGGESHRGGHGPESY